MIGPAFEALLGDAKGGDEHAFGVLYRDLQPSLLRYLRVLAPRAAEDLAAETWLRVVRQLGRFGGAEPAFRAWVFLIARHRAIDWRRQAVRRQTDPVPVTAFVDQWAADDPAACALEAISTQAAITLIASLPVEQAEVIMLRVVAGLEVARVAELVGKPPGTVRVLAHRGLRRLAERLGAEVGVHGVM